MAGRATALYARVLQAAAAGVTAGAAINADLVAEDTRRAVAARRATPTSAGQRFWEQHHQQHDRPDVGLRLNPVVAAVASDLTAGRALDLGCGEGGDTLGLAGLGWEITAVDVSRPCCDGSETVPVRPVCWTGSASSSMT